MNVFTKIALRQQEWLKSNEIKLGSFFIYKGGLIHRDLKDLSHWGVFPGGQTFCSRSQGVAATIWLFVTSDENKQIVRWWHYLVTSSAGFPAMSIGLQTTPVSIPYFNHSIMATISFPLTFPSGWMRLSPCLLIATSKLAGRFGSDTWVTSKKAEP